MVSKEQTVKRRNVGFISRGDEGFDGGVGDVDDDVGATARFQLGEDLQEVERVDVG